MFGFLKRYPFAYLSSLKLKTLDEFVRVVNEEKPSEIVVGGRLSSPGLSLDTRGDILFVATMRNGRSATYTEKLFDAPGGLVDIKTLAQLYLRADHKIQNLQLKIPKVPIRFESIYLPNGSPVHITDETRGKLTRLAAETGVK